MSKAIGIGLLLALSLQGFASAELATVSRFSDLLFWAGSGTNEAALVLYFNPPSYGDGGSPAAVAWGYRWDGEKTQQDMLFSLAGTMTVTGSPPSPPTPQPGSDPRLAVDVSYYDFFGLKGYLITSLRYDQIGLPSPWQQVERVMDNTTPPPEAGFIDIAPYRFLSGATAEWPAGGGFDLIADTGISDTTLVDGGWYGFVEALYEVQDNQGEPVYIGFPSTYTFTQPVAAVPEPSGIVLLGCGGAIVSVMAWRRRRRRAA
jgi:hypothetical protein